MIKKTTLLLFFILATTCSLFGQVQVGMGTNTEQKIPIQTYFGYSYSQSIYLASEINATGTITSIQWYYNGSGALPNNQDLVVYMGTTAKTAFSSTTDWVASSNLMQVYTGGITTNSTPGWKTLTLTTPFIYDGVSNLIVAVDENQEMWDDYNDTFYNTAVTGTRSIFTYSDGDNPSPTSPPEAHDIVPFVPNIIFGGITQACATPYYVHVNNVTTSTATVSWQASTIAPLNGSSYYLSTSDAVPTSATTPTGTITSGETVNLIDLTPETVYYFWIKNNCETGLFSSWSSTSSFKTDCVAITAFTENFDATNTPELPSCWNKILRGDESLSQYATIETNDWYSQTQPISVRMDSNQSDMTTADLILVSPNLSTLALGTYRLKFFARGNGSLQVGTLSSNDSEAVFTENSLGDVITNSTFTEYVVEFANYTGTDKYIGIRLATSNSNVSIDNVRWEPIPACPDVTAITVPSVTTSGATIEWLSGNQSTSVSWDIVVGSASDTDPTSLTPVTSTTTSKDIIGLTENTNYKVWVRTVCAAESGAWIGPISFKTACSGIPAFYENFNTTEAPGLPDCWSTIARGASLSEFYMIETNQYSELFEDDNNAVQIFNENSGNDADMILVAPSLTTLGLGTYRLKFYAKHGYTPASVDIVTLSSNTSFAESTLYETVLLSDNTAQYVVDFSSYTGTDSYFGFRINATETYSSIYIDNILWELTPSCPDVTLVNVPETTASTATVSWTGSGAEESWDVAVSATSQDPTTLSFTNFTTATAAIPDLIDNTNYSVWVRSVCMNNDKGAWIGPVSFKTACLPTAAFNEDFESAETPDLPSCWSSIIRGATVSEYAYLETSPWSNMPDETTAVVMNTSESSLTDDIILVSPSVSTLSLGSYRLKFKAKGASSVQIGTLNSNTDSAEFTPLQTIVTTDVPTVYAVEFSNYTGTDTFIGIRANTESQYQYIEIDNIVWQPIPLCPDIENLKKTGTTMTTAGVIWDTNTSSQYHIVKGALDVTNPETLTATTVTNGNFTFLDLTPGTSYKVWVRSVCDAAVGSGEWTEPIVVATQCTATDVPYSEDFESAFQPVLPECTSSLNLADAPSTWYTSYYPGYGYESSTLTYNGDLYTDANSWFFTRGINLVAGQNYTISYRYGGASTDTFFYNNNLIVKFGTQASPENMTLDVAEHIDFATDTPILSSVTVTAPTTGVYYFGFNVTSPNNSYFMYLDDILIDTALSTGNFIKDTFTYYPNPVQNILNIGYVDAIDSVQVFNMLGQEVFQTSGNSTTLQIDMSSFAKGTYLVKIISGSTMKNIKVIKS
ncbi:T9SS type A sorting domain-containing protein [Flavobacterium sp. SM2513]|uniref:T9SS type A sorting domain-containing protein n=1 Tax=Flavobacterium sp. SM2513 TaxID=3424766 RepID=UPI003D7FA465